MFISAIIILSGLLSAPIGADDVWLEPNAWEIHSPSPNTCPVCDIPDVPTGNDITTTYYKNAIAQLLNRNSLKINSKSGRLERKLTLSLTAAQLNIIENSSDIRDFHTVVMAVLTIARELEEKQATPRTKESKLLKLQYILEFIYSMLTRVVKFGFENSEIRFAIFVCAVLLTIWFFHKRYNKNLIFLLIASFIMVGYFCTYIECNRQLEAESFIQFINENEPDEPNYFSKLLEKFFKSSEKAKKIEKIKNESKVKLGFCRPDDVAIMYFNAMFFKQMQAIIEQIVYSMNSIRDSLPFPFNYMGMMALPFLFIAILPLLFQYILNPASWSMFFRGMSSSHQREEMINNNTHHGDRLSGDNLKMFIEVMKIKAGVEETPKNSSVEDVKDLPAAIKDKFYDSLSGEEKNEDNGFVRIDDISEEETKKKS